MEPSVVAGQAQSFFGNPTVAITLLLISIIGISVLFIGTVMAMKRLSTIASAERLKRESLEITTARVLEENRSLHLDIQQLERNYNRLGEERADLERKLRSIGDPA